MKIQEKVVAFFKNYLNNIKIVKTDNINTKNVANILFMTMNEEIFRTKLRVTLVFKVFGILEEENKKENFHINFIDKVLNYVRVKIHTSILVLINIFVTKIYSKERL